MPPTSQAGATFENAIQEAEVLLKHFSGLPQKLHNGSEVLKSAGLVMALTAWETYVEDRVLEEVDRRWGCRAEGHTVTAGQLLRAKLEEELRSFHTPNAGNTRKLFRDFVGVDVTTGWNVLGQRPDEVKKRLSELTKKRGEVVHRAKAVTSGGPTQQHLVKKDELSKHIRFLKELVKATDAALGGSVSAEGTSTPMNVPRASAAAAAA